MFSPRPTKSFLLVIPYIYLHNICKREAGSRGGGGGGGGRCSPNRGTYVLKHDWNRNDRKTCSKNVHAQKDQNQNLLTSSTSILLIAKTCCQIHCT